VAKALGEGDEKVVSILNTTSLAGYAVYAEGEKLRSVVLVNQEIFNSSTSAAGERKSVAFQLPKELCGGNAKASVQRLSGAGAEVREGIEFAGQTVALDGKIEGSEAKEVVQDGVVEIKATEAVLISFEEQN